MSIFGEKKLAFFISSTLPTCIFAYTAITLIYTEIPLDKVTLIAAGILFAILFVILKIIRLLIPVYHSREEIKEMFSKRKS